MSTQIPHFWQLLEESELLSHQHCQQLRAEYANVKGAAQQGNARTLAEWLVSRNVLSRYQITLLLAGRPGPFLYGDYKVYDRIEAGRLAGMFRAVHGETGHPVLLHFLAGTDSADAQRWEAAANRVQEQFGVEHRHLHRCFELVDLESFKFLVYDDLRGDPLSDHVAGGRYAVGDAAYIAYCVAAGLAELHGQGLVHGDVRPHNIWLESNGNLKLLRDILRGADSYSLGQSSAEDQAARADYLAPEMARGDQGGCPTTDIYALGCTFYQLLSGKPPFGGANVGEKLVQHARAPIEPLEPLGVPQPLAKVVAYMMAKNPGVRYHDASLLSEHLRAFADPDRLNAPAPHQAATLASYTHAIQQRQHQLAPAGVAAASTPQTDVPSFPHFEGEKGRKADSPFDFPAREAAATPKLSAEEAAEKYRQKKEKTPKEMAMILGGIAALVIVVIVGIQFIPSGNSYGDDVAAADPSEQPLEVEEDFNAIELAPARSTFEENSKPPNEQATGSGTKDTQPARPAVEVVQVADDGTMLWPPPTVGEPIDFAYVPPGGQIFLVVRPAEMLATQEGTRVLEALGSQFESIRSDWEATAGVSLQQIEQMIISLHDNNDQMPRATTVVRLATPMTFENLLSGWGNPPEIKPNSSMYSVSGQVVYLPREAGGKLFVMGSQEEVLESAQFNGAEPPLRREVQQLLSSSDANRHFTLIFAPNYLFSGGRAIFTGDWEKLLEPLDQFLGDGLQAVMLAMQFDEQFYLEAKLISELGTDPGVLAANMRDRLAAIPNAMEEYVVSLNPHPYWKRLALRYPQMIRYMSRYTRVGTEGDHAVINTVMPGVAAHNIVKASELALVSTPGDVTAVVSNGGGNNKPVTLQDALQTKLSIDIPQTSLEFAMRDLATEVRDANPGLEGFDITIIGTDLQLNGITRNQQIRDFEVTDKPVSEILTALCMKANPVTTVTDPSEEDQKLLWVVAPEGKTILITTRESAAKKNYTLPAPFQPK